GCRVRFADGNHPVPDLAWRRDRTNPSTPTSRRDPIDDNAKRTRLTGCTRFERERGDHFRVGERQTKSCTVPSNGGCVPLDVVVSKEQRLHAPVATCRFQQSCHPECLTKRDLLAG